MAQKKYIYDGEEYTKQGLIDFADTSTHYDRMDASDGEPVSPITTIEEAIEALGADNVKVKKYSTGGSIDGWSGFVNWLNEKF